MPHAAPSKADVAALIRARIQERLAAHGLSVLGAAVQAGLPRDAFRNSLRTEGAAPGGGTLVQCAFALDTTVAYLVGETDNPERAFVAAVKASSDDLELRLLADLADRGEHFHGFSAEAAVFHYVDRLRARVAELEVADRRPRLEVVR